MKNQNNFNRKEEESFYSDTVKRSSNSQISKQFQQKRGKINESVCAPARKAGDLGPNPGPGENFSLKLTTPDLPDGYTED